MKKMKVKDQLSQDKKIIEAELKKILFRQDTLLFNAMRHAVFSGGKRFRPLLTLSSGECFGVHRAMLLPFACSLELIHNYSLVHDDLPSMDNDDFRRNKPSCHKAYGEDIALLAGDGLLTLAFEVLARAEVEEKLLPKKELVIKEISGLSGVNGMIGGQLLDITLSQKEMTEDILYELILKKTGALIIAALNVGAILGDASASEIEAIAKYGRNIGLAFQIRDDILDSTEERKKDAVPRPNSIAFFGPEGAKRKLIDFVSAGISALHEVSMRSDKLLYLASSLLEFNGKQKDELYN